MVKLLNWFQINYPELKRELQKCNHNFSENETNPYHVEGDCWTHTMLVCKVAQLKKYNRVVQVSALLHDIAKPKARVEDREKGHVIFWGHEELSAKMAKPLVDDLVQKEMLLEEEAKEVIELIALHGEIYKDREGVEKKLKDKPKWLQHLLELHECDDLGRFSLSMREI